MRQGAKGLRALAWLVAGVGLLVASGAGAVWWWLDHPLALARPSIELSIESGASPREVADAWVAAGVQTDAAWLYAWFRASGQARRIRAGSYEVHAGITPRALLDALVQGHHQSLGALFVAQTCVLFELLGDSGHSVGREVEEHAFERMGRPGRLLGALVQVDADFPVQEGAIL